jgi:uncharacterized protein with GYD domain
MVTTMIQFSYTPQAMAKLVKHPDDRSRYIKEIIEKMGGRMLAFYYTYGDFDGFVLAETPDSTSALAVNFAAANPEVLARTQTTICFPVNDAIQAMRKSEGLAIPSVK